MQVTIVVGANENEYVMEVRKPGQEIHAFD